MRHVLSILMLASLAGCSVDRDPVRPPAPDTSIRTSVTIRPATVAPGEPSEIVIRATNRGFVARTLHFSSGCLMGWRLRDAVGTVVAPGPRLCTDDAPSITLAPGETMTQVFTWNGTRYDPSSGLFLIVPPGTYQLFGGLHEDGSGWTAGPVRVDVLP